MKNALFVCGKARMRSPTAAALAEQIEGVAADFARRELLAEAEAVEGHILNIQRRRDTRPAHFPVPITFEVSNPRLLFDLARQGAGHVVLPRFVGDAEPDLVRSGENIAGLSHDQWLVVHGEDRNQPPVRRTVDLIAGLIVSARKGFVGLD